MTFSIIYLTYSLRSVHFKYFTINPNAFILHPDINECTSLPCQNGGTCTDLVAAYSCQCAAGYTGIQCQTSEKSSSVLVYLLCFVSPFRIN